MIPGLRDRKHKDGRFYVASEGKIFKQSLGRMRPVWLAKTAARHWRFIQRPSTGQALILISAARILLSGAPFQTTFLAKP
jgi:hypothetical protein